MINPRLFLKICCFLATTHHGLLRDSAALIAIMYKRKENIFWESEEPFNSPRALVPAVSIRVRQGKLGTWAHSGGECMTLETHCLNSTAGYIKSIMFAWVMFSESWALKILQKTTGYLRSKIPSFLSWPRLQLNISKRHQVFRDDERPLGS